MVVGIDVMVTCWHGPLMEDVSSAKNVLPVPFLWVQSLGRESVK